MDTEGEYAMGFFFFLEDLRVGLDGVLERTRDFFDFGVDSCSEYERILSFRGERSSSDENFKTKINLKNYNIERKKALPNKIGGGMCVPPSFKLTEFDRK